MAGRNFTDPPRHFPSGAQEIRSPALLGLFLESVNRMRRIDRIAVDADVLPKPAPLLKPGAMVVMFEAERAEGAVPERLPIIPMRWIVIGDDGGGHRATGQAFAAQGLAPKLVEAPLLPHL